MKEKFKLKIIKYMQLIGVIAYLGILLYALTRNDYNAEIEKVNNEVIKTLKKEIYR